MPPTPHFFGFCWKVKELSVQCMAGFENFRPEVNWQCTDFDPFYTVSYGTCFSGLLPEIIMLRWRFS